MRLSENRILAWIVLSACVLVSVFGLGGMHLRKERSDVLDVFYNGTQSGQTERNSMDAYLDRAAECAQIMAYEAQLYLGEDNADAAHMLNSLASFGDDDALEDRYQAYVQIQQDSDTLYNAMYAKKLLDGERVNFKRAYDDFWGCDKYIRKDPYRDLAVEYNQSIAAFPASAVAALVGAQELSSFGA